MEEGIVSVSKTERWCNILIGYTESEFLVRKKGLPHQSILRLEKKSGFL